jgi:uncharacterized membrane protein YdjX (TVP38/TMEM64 family)
LNGIYQDLLAMTEPLQRMLQAAAQDPSPLRLLLVVLILALMPFSIVVPMTASCLLAGALLPAWLAPWVILTGLLLNTVLSWSLARSVVGSRVEAWIERRGGALATVRRHAREGGIKWTFMARFIPAPFISPPIVLASAGVPLGQVLSGTALAMLPWSFAYAWAGRAGRQGSLKSMALAATAFVFILAVAALLRRRVLGGVEAADQRNPSPKPRVSRGGAAKRKAQGGRKP